MRWLGPRTRKTVCTMKKPASNHAALKGDDEFCAARFKAQAAAKAAEDAKEKARAVKRRLKKVRQEFKQAKKAAKKLAKLARSAEEEELKLWAKKMAKAKKQTPEVHRPAPVKKSVRGAVGASASATKAKPAPPRKKLLAPVVTPPTSQVPTAPKVTVPPVATPAAARSTQ